MNRLCLFVTALILCAVSASAAISDNQPSAPPSVPQSIWSLDAANTAIHQQSSLTCAYEINGFQRTRLIVYDTFGFDVSCNYVDRPHSVITIYLTRRGTNTLTDDFEKAKWELLQVTPEAVPLAEAEQKDIALPRSWQRVIYSEKGGSVHSGIWMADIVGWTLEFRATYAPENESVVLAEMALLTEAAEQSAGAHLGRCAKSQIPVRGGAVEASDMAKVLGGLVVLAAASEDPAKPAYAEPKEWCAEEGSVTDNVPVILWHGIDENGGALAADRVTVVSVGPAPAIESVDLPDFGQILTELSQRSNKVPGWAVKREQGDETLILGFYEGRPDASALASAMALYVKGRAHVVGSFNRKTKQINIVTDKPE